MRYFTLLTVTWGHELKIPRMARSLVLSHFCRDERGLVCFHVVPPVDAGKVKLLLALSLLALNFFFSVTPKALLTSSDD